MANPNFGTFNRPGAIADQASFDVGLRTHMVRVYNYMASGLALSGIVAFGLFSSAELASLFFQVQAGRVVGLNVLGWVAIGYTTKRDLTAMGKFLFMGVIGLILAGLVNMIWPSGTMSFIISAAGVLIFSGLIAYDTQKIKEQYAEAWGTEMAEKIAIFGALSLYLDFVNLFQFLMAFMGQSRD